MNKDRVCLYGVYGDEWRNALGLTSGLFSLYENRYIN